MEDRHWRAIEIAVEVPERESRLNHRSLTEGEQEKQLCVSTSGRRAPAEITIVRASMHVQISYIQELLAVWKVHPQGMRNIIIRKAGLGVQGTYEQSAHRR